MASDEELARQVARAEEDSYGDVPSSSSTGEELDEYKRTAGEIHDELARRIESIDEQTPDEDDLSEVLERLDRLEDRIEALEADR